MIPYVQHGLHSDLGALFVVRVHDVRQEPALAVTQLRFALELLDGALVHHARCEHDVTADGGLAGVDMADEHDIDVLAGIFLGNELVERERRSLKRDARKKTKQWKVRFR